MLQITPQHRLLLAVAPLDFRAGIDVMVARCRLVLAQDPFSGAVFAFTNRRRIAVKLLVYDGTGFWLCHKRFSHGKLKWWPTGDQTSVTLRASELAILLAQGHPLKAGVPDDWRALPHAA